MLTIIYEDEALLALNKPAGLLSVPGKTEPNCLAQQALDYNPNCRVVHRLDMATSGLILFAKSHAAQKQLGHQFERRTISKQYRAVILGSPSASQGEINLPLICDWPNRPKQKVCYETGKTAVTHYQVTRALTIDEQLCSEVLLKPVTGRSHQLRVHCHELGHGILGDQLYHRAGSEQLAERLLLHAETLWLRHPVTDVPLELNCPAQFGL